MIIFGIISLLLVKEEFEIVIFKTAILSHRIEKNTPCTVQFWNMFGSIMAQVFFSIRNFLENINLRALWATRQSLGQYTS